MTQAEFSKRDAGGCIRCARPVFQRQGRGLGLVDPDAVRAMFTLADMSHIEVTFCAACAATMDGEVNTDSFLNGLWLALLEGWKVQGTPENRPWLSRTALDNFILDYKCRRRWIDVMTQDARGKMT